MKTEGGKYIYTKEEVGQVIKNGLAKNPDADVNDIISYLLSQDNIYVADGNKLSDIKPIGYVYQGDEGLKELLSYADFSVDKNNNIIKGAEDNSLKKDDLTKDEKISLSSNVDKDRYTKIWNDELAGFDETEPLMENAKRIATAYRKLLDEKSRITDDYDSGQGGDKNIYLQRIKDISSALRDAENSPEFKYIVNQIKENGITREDKNFSPIVSTTLTDMARHDGSLYGLKPAKSTGGRISNWLLGDVDNSGFVRFMQGVTPQDMNNLENLPEIYSNTNKKINEYLSKKKGNKDSKDNKSEDTKSNNNLNVSNSPVKPKNITDKNVTDEMKFGDDVKEVGGQTYLEDRNKALATHLKLRGIETPEEIDEYLSQYSSWKNAKPEWKENTKKVLSEKVANIKTNGKVEDKKEEDKGEDINNEDVKEAVEGDKETPIKDKINKGVDKFRDVLENPNEYIKKGADWLNKLQPNDESPLNGAEEDEINIAEPMFDRSGKIVGTQRSEAYIYDKNGKPVGSKKSDKYIYDKNGRPIGSKWMPSNDDSINGVEEDEVDIAEPMYDKNGKIVGTQRSDAYIYDKNGNPVGSKKNDKYIYDKNGKPVGSKAKENKENKKDKNEVKDNGIYTEPMYDKNGKVVGTKRSDAYLFDKKGNPNGSKKTDKYMYDKNGNIVGSKSTKKSEKKVTIKDIKKAIKKDPNVKNALQNSKVIQGLLNIKKGK